MGAFNPGSAVGTPQNTPAAQANGGVTLVKAAVNPNSEIQVKLVVGATPNNSGNNLLILKSLCPGQVISQLGAALPDQNNVTLTSSISASGTISEWYGYMSLSGLTISYIRINTTTPALFNGNLYYGVANFTGKFNPAYFPLVNYAIPTSSGFQNNATISTNIDGTPLNMALVPNSFMYFDNVPISGTITLTFGVSGASNANLNS